MALIWLRDQFKHQKIILWGVIIVFLVLVFVDWGSGRPGGGGGGSGDAAVRVDDYAVSEQTFVRELRNKQRLFQERFGEQWETLRDQLDLPAMTLQEYIGRGLMLKEAETLGLKVSEKELQEAILAEPFFQKEDGGFVGLDGYRRRLRAMNMTFSQHERSVREGLLINKLRSMVRNGIHVSDAEAEESYRRKTEVVDCDVMQVRHEPFLTEVEVDETEAEAYYNEHGEDFQRPEQRSIRYLLVETTKLRRQLQVEDSELQAFYNQRKSDFKDPEKIHLRQILIAAPEQAPPADRNQARVRAEMIGRLAKAEGSEQGPPDFAQLASIHSEDPATNQNGGDLGDLARGSMPPEIENATWAAKPGDIVGPLETRWGYHIIKIEGKSEPRQQTLEEAMEDVRFRLLDGRSAAEAETRAHALAGRISDEELTTQEQWQTLADSDEAASLNISPPFALEEAIEGVGDDPALASEAFAKDVDVVGGARPMARGWIVWQVHEIKPEGVPPLDDVRGEVEQQVKQAKALDRAAARGQELAERWRAGETAETLAEEFATTVEEARSHRRGAHVSSIGVVPALDSAVFAAEPLAIVGPIKAGENGILVALVQSVKLVDDAELATAIPDERSSLMDTQANWLLSSILNQRRQEAFVQINNDMMARINPQSRQGQQGPQGPQGPRGPQAPQRPRGPLQ